MPNLNIQIMETCFYFSVGVDNLKEQYISPTIILSGIPWNIRIRKFASDVGEAMDIYLNCSPEIYESDWICEAEAIITLRSTVSQQRLYQKNLPRQKFCSTHQTGALLQFIQCDDLIQYEQNGRVVFEVILRADPLRYIALSYIEQSRTTFQFTIDDVSTLDVYSSKRTDKLVLRGTGFSVMIRRNEELLQTFLCDERDSRNQNWTWNVNFCIKLLSFDENVQPIVKTIETVFYYDMISGFSSFVDWNDFIDPLKKYVLNDRAIFEIDLEVDPPKPIVNYFADKHKPSNDFVLECSICLQSMIGREPNLTKCGHLFCGCCIKRWIGVNLKCPNCNSDAVLTELRPVYI